MLLRERETPEGLLVSVADDDVVGETFAESEVSLTVTEEFYGGADADDADADAVVESLARATVANIVGEEAVRVAVNAGIVDENRVLHIDGTQHAQLLQMR